MRQPLFIGIDIGTQGTKAVLCDRNGRILADAFEASRLVRPGDGSVYEEPDRVFSSVLHTIRAVAGQADRAGGVVAAVGMDSQMAGIVGVGPDFEAVTPLDSWLDTRCAPYTEAIRRQAEEEAIRSSGGPVINAHASKLLWWKGERPDVYARAAKFVMPNGYVAGKLCGLRADEAFMDYTFLHFNSFSDNAGRRFNSELLRRFGVAEEKLPRIVSPQEVVGVVRDAYADACGLPHGVKVVAGCGDTAASSLGAGVTRAGLAYDVAGTASVFACGTDRFAPDVRHKTILFARSVLEGLYIPLAYISGGGICLKWFASLCGKSLRELDGLAEREAPGCGGITFIPHFSGRTCPLDNDVSGAFLGLRGSPYPGLLYRSILESVAYEYQSYLGILRENGCITELETVRGAGGGAKSAVFAQIKADVLGVDYQALKNGDTAPPACALIAACGCGYADRPLAELCAAYPEEGALTRADGARSAAYAQGAARYRRRLEQIGALCRD
ncbi:MAG TPA: hypothetical protein H9684_07405 [Firmicutes bacterium]|nr:hypothetical protein [Bacillota bacterium]